MQSASRVNIITTMPRGATSATFKGKIIGCLGKPAEVNVQPIAWNKRSRPVCSNIFSKSASKTLEKNGSAKWQQQGLQDCGATWLRQDARSGKRGKHVSLKDTCKDGMATKHMFQSYINLNLQAKAGTKAQSHITTAQRTRMM